jgi:transposase-like protein
MDILNRDNLRKAIREGKFTSIDDVANEFKSILKEVLQESAEEELTEHLGYDKHTQSDNPNYRNGYGTKSVKTKYGDVELDMPRDRDSTFKPKLVKKRETILEGSEDLIISLYAKGMSVRDIQAHLDDLYGYELSEQTISNITDRVIEKAKEWLPNPMLSAKRSEA